MVEIGLPKGIATDAAGFGNEPAASLTRLFAPYRVVSTRAGGPYNPAATQDGVGPDARFNAPFDVVYAEYPQGSPINRFYFVSDFHGNVIRKITETGDVTVLAGSGVTGSADGNGVNAQFNNPAGLAFDPVNANLYVADSSNNSIRKINVMTGDVTTFVPPGTLNHPMGIAWDPGYMTGNAGVFISDTGNHCIRKADAASMSLVIGSPGTPGTSDDPPRLNSPYGLSYDNSYNILAIADYGNHTIRSYTPGSTVLGTVAGYAGVGSYFDGQGTSAMFNHPTDVEYYGYTLFVADRDNHCIRAIDSGGNVTTRGNVGRRPGWSPGMSGYFRFDSPTAVGLATSVLAIADQGNHRVALISLETGACSPLAGVIPHADANGAGARFYAPGGTAVDGSGNVYVADTKNHVIRKIDLAGNVTTVAGVPGCSGLANGSLGTNLLFHPKGIAFPPGSNTLYIADSGNNAIRRLDPTSQEVDLITGNGNAGYAYGNPASTMLNAPSDLVFDGSGNLFVCDSGNNAICKLDSSFYATVFAGPPTPTPTPGDVDGNGTTARFSNPVGISIDAAGNLFVADRNNYKVRKITPAADVSTVLTFGVMDAPYGIEAIPGEGLLVTAPAMYVVRQLALNGLNGIVAGTSGSYGAADGTGISASFNGPLGITVDAGGTFYLADSGNNTIRVGSLP